MVDPRTLLDPALLGPMWTSAAATVAPGRRWQDDRIVALVPDGAAVLDLGCGDGALLARLVAERQVRAQGVENAPAAVMACIARGVPVFQANLDDGLAGFADASFDVVICEETLPSLYRPLAVLAGMLRVGRRCIVTFPNAAFWRWRFDLALRGRVPVAAGYHWHDTPAIRPLALQDLLDWLAQAGATLEGGLPLTRDGVRPLQHDDNLQAEQVLLVLRSERRLDPHWEVAI